MWKPPLWLSWLNNLLASRMRQIGGLHVNRSIGGWQLLHGQTVRIRSQCHGSSEKTLTTDAPCHVSLSFVRFETVHNKETTPLPVKGLHYRWRGFEFWPTLDTQLSTEGSLMCHTSIRLYGHLRGYRDIHTCCRTFGSGVVLVFIII